MATTTKKVTGTGGVYQATTAGLSVTETAAAGANTYIVSADQTSAKLALTGTGDKIVLNGSSYDYKVSVSGNTVTLKSADQTVAVTLPKATTAASITDAIYFLDGQLDLVRTTAGVKLGTQVVTGSAKDVAATVTASTLALDHFSGVTPIAGSTLGSSLLTVDPDTLTGASTYNAYSLITAAGVRVDSLQSYDTVTGTGSSTMNVVTGTAIVANPTISGVSTINFAPEAAAGTINLSKTTGLKTANVDLSQQNATLTNVASSVTTVGVTSGSIANDTLVNFADAAVAGSADSINLVLTGNGNASVASTEFINLAGTSVGGFETLNITATGTNRVAEILSDSAAAIGLTATATNAVTKMVVGGTGSLRVQNALTTTTTFDASQNTGGVNVQLNNAGAITVTGGTGADTFDLIATLTNADKIDGGAGRDTLATTSAITAGNQITNVEILRNDAGNNFSNTNVSSVDAIIHNAAAGATYSNMVGANAADSTKGLTLQGVGAVQFDILNATGLGANSDALYVKVGSATGTTGVNAAAGAAAGGVTSAGTETITVNVVANNTATNTATGLGGLTATTVQTLNITGGAAGQAFAVGAITNAGASLTKIDASTFVGNLTVNGGALSQAITGGTGNDTIGTGGRTAYAAGTSGEVLTGGTGNDNFIFVSSSAATADTVLSAANITAIDGNAAANGRVELARITDLNLGGSTAATQVDKITFTENGTATAASLADAATVATNISIVNGGAATALTGADLGAALSTAVNGGVLAVGTGAGTIAAGLFTWGGDTYLVATELTAVNDAWATVAGRDLVIKVTGVTGTLDASDFI